MGIFMRMMDGLSAAKTEPRTITIDATSPQGTPHGFQPAVKKGDPGRLPITDQNGRSLSFFMTAGQIVIIPVPLPCWTV
ncbi:hypothetical protein GLF_0555 [Gluconobacter frateurii NBRC 101659]|nr:hypothetical protein GLF_0555 [Gluconobacter frateurii NBRC 101659]